MNLQRSYDDLITGASTINYSNHYNHNDADVDTALVPSIIQPKNRYSSTLDDNIIADDNEDKYSDDGDTKMLLRMQLSVAPPPLYSTDTKRQQTSGFCNSRTSSSSNLFSGRFNSSKTTTTETMKTAIGRSKSANFSYVDIIKNSNFNATNSSTCLGPKSIINTVESIARERNVSKFPPPFNITDNGSNESVPHRNSASGNLERSAIKMLSSLSLSSIVASTQEADASAAMLQQQPHYQQQKQIISSSSIVSPPPFMMTASTTMAATTSLSCHTINTTTTSATPTSLLKCFCSWKNCRVYQKAFREAKHPLFDGTVKIKLVYGHKESMIYKDCLDRTLGIDNDSIEWKQQQQQSVGNNDKEKRTVLFCKYIIAKHHFTAKHMEKYHMECMNRDASYNRPFSFVKPLTIHGAKKYLYAINDEETIPSPSTKIERYSGGDDTVSTTTNDNNYKLLYLQCPNVPRDVVKIEFYKALETVKEAKRFQKQEQQQQIKPQQARHHHGSQSIVEAGKKYLSKTIGNNTKAMKSPTSQTNYASVLLSVKQMDDENMMLKTQLDAVKSQILFLHNMVLKLQEQILYEQATTGTISSKSAVSNRSRSSAKSKRSTYTNDTKNSSDRAHRRSTASASNVRSNRQPYKAKMHQHQQPKDQQQKQPKQHVMSGRTLTTFESSCSSTITNLSSLAPKTKTCTKNKIPNHPPGTAPSKRKTNLTDKLPSPAMRGTPMKINPTELTSLSIYNVGNLRRNQLQNILPVSGNSIHGVPVEINFGDINHVSGLLPTPGSSWREGDWSVVPYDEFFENEKRFGGVDNAKKSVESGDDDDDGADKTIATTGTFVSKYKQRLSQLDDGHEEDESDDDGGDYDDCEDAITLGASTIFSASKSIRSVEKDLTSQDDDECTIDEKEFVGDTPSKLNPSGYITPPSAHSRSMYDHGQTTDGPMRIPTNEIGPNCIGTLSAISTRMPSCERENSRSGNNSSNTNANESSSGRSTVGRRLNKITTDHVIDLMITKPYWNIGTYTGSVQLYTNVPQGYGRMEYMNSVSWYEGDWQGGDRCGHGQLLKENGDFYEGEFKFDCEHGHGDTQCADGRIYQGEYHYGQMTHGKMTYEDGSTYEGSWVDGLRQGTGRCVFADESYYDGEFQYGNFCGYGKMVWRDGGYYTGSWLNGEMHGYGKEVYADGTIRHEGEWIEGLPYRQSTAPEDPQQHQQQES